MIIEQGEPGRRIVDGVITRPDWEPQTKPAVVVCIQRVLCKGARVVVADLVRAIEAVVEEDRRIEQAMGEALPASPSADTEPPTRIGDPEVP